MMFKRYLQVLTRHHLLGNLISVAGGFFLGLFVREIDWILMLATVIGLSLVVALACVITNFVADRDIDAKMQRTRKTVVTVTEKCQAKPLFSIVLY